MEKTSRDRIIEEKRGDEKKVKINVTDLKLLSELGQVILGISSCNTM